MIIKISCGKRCGKRSQRSPHEGVKGFHMRESEGVHMRDSEGVHMRDSKEST